LPDISFLAELGCTNSAGFELCLDGVVYTASAIIAALGTIGVFVGRHMIREAREERAINEAMEEADRSKQR
jgi:hypothetical protein